jgi:GT2 family glycosyltransferase
VSTPASVVIPCHTLRRWDRLVAAVRSVQAQRPAPVEIVVVVDHNDELLARVRRELPEVTALANRYGRGVSGNRNTGVEHTGTDAIALLDDDSSAHPGWLAALVEDRAVVGTGGAIRPTWQGRRPDWFPDEFLWVVGGSGSAVAAGPERVRNVWSASMAVRRDVFESVGGFRVGFGKVGERARPEDTDLCLRMSRVGGGHWIFVPAAVIDHPVPAERATFRGYLRRCYQEGRGKVELARLNRGGQGLAVERDYLRRTLPRAVGGYLSRAVREADRSAAARAGSVLAGVAAAAVGGVVSSALLAGRQPGVA